MIEPLEHLMAGIKPAAVVFKEEMKSIPRDLARIDKKKMLKTDIGVGILMVGFCFIGSKIVESLDRLFPNTNVADTDIALLKGAAALTFVGAIGLQAGLNITGARLFQGTVTAFENGIRSWERERWPRYSRQLPLFRDDIPVVSLGNDAKNLSQSPQI